MRTEEESGNYPATARGRRPSAPGEPGTQSGSLCIFGRPVYARMAHRGNCGHPPLCSDLTERNGHAQRCNRLLAFPCHIVLRCALAGAKANRKMRRMLRIASAYSRRPTCPAQAQGHQVAAGRLKLDREADLSSLAPLRINPTPGTLSKSIYGSKGRPDCGSVTACNREFTCESARHCDQCLLSW